MKKHLSIKTLLISLGLILSFISEAKTIYYVKENGTGSGTSWTNAAGSIQSMIDKAVSGDEVWVAKGTYYPTTETIARDARSRTFLMKDGVSLYGGFAGTESSIAQRVLADLDSNCKVDSFELVNTTLLSGDIDGVTDVWTKTMNSDGETWTWSITGNEGNCYRIVTSQTNFVSKTYFDGFMVSGGNSNSDGNGGGIYACNNTCINNCTIYKCTATKAGGGIFGAAYEISNCKITNCFAGASGGGIYASISSSCDVLNCDVKDCYAGVSGNGGGIYSESATMCTVTNCFAGNSGGGIYTSLNVTKCIIDKCLSMNSEGGGIRANKAVGCIVSNSTAHTSGGGIYSIYTTINCHVTNCKSNNYGGGIFAYSLNNCVVINCFSEKAGGGIYASNATNSYIVNCTASNCSTNETGGGIYGGYNVANCTVSNCYAGISGGGLYSSYYVMNCAINNNIAGSVKSNIAGGKGQSGCISFEIQSAFEKPSSFIGIAKSDTQQEELQSTDWRLKEGSPCINAGTTALSSIQNSTDIEGVQRIIYGNIDIGAYEYSVPTITMLAIEKFDSWTDFNNSSVFYNSATINGGQNIKWSIANQKADFSWQTNLTTTYSQPIFTYQIDATKTSKVVLRYDMYFQAYSGTISPLGTEKLNVEVSTDLVTWTNIATYSNQNGTIPNKTYLHDISSKVAGKTFFVRFNANGANSNRIEKWEIDNVIIDTDGNTALAVSQSKQEELNCTVIDGKLLIQNADNGTTIQLYDVNGRLLGERKAESISTMLELPLRGVYVVKAVTGNANVSKKVVW